jgi:hypothetical protein
LPDIEPFHHQDTQHLVSGNSEQVGATNITTVVSSAIMEKGHDARGKERGEPQPQLQPRQTSMMTIVAVAAVVSLISGAIGAMGYTHYVAPKSNGSPASQSHSGSGANSQSPSTRSSGETAASGTSELRVGDEAAELKQQIINLNKRIERLGEQVDRLQELLSLTVPLLQRMAPKH